MLYFHYPINLVVNGKTIFCNMRFIDNQIILTGAVYLYTPIEYKQLKYFVNNIIYNEVKVIERREYEPSVVCILENDEWKDEEKVELKINYNNRDYIYILEKEKHQKYQFVAMTLFKYDYRLIDLYVDYYSKLGIECFYLYYNGKLDELNLDFIKDCDKNIHITEWNYSYWLRPDINREHHAQVMSIMDALYLSKKVSKYCLFNDFDEYVFLKEKSLNEFTEKNPSISNFSFESFWTMIGEDPIEYKDAKQDFYTKNLIINQNGCGNQRRKSLVKTSDIDIMRIHFPDYSGKNFLSLYCSGFYHLCNFKEMDRRFLCQKNLIQNENNRFSPNDVNQSQILTSLEINTYHRYICDNLQNISMIKNLIELEIWSREIGEIQGFQKSKIHEGYHVYQREIKNYVGFQYFWKDFFTVSERMYLIHLLSLIPNGLFERDINKCNMIYHSYFGNTFGKKDDSKKYIFFSGEKYPIPTDQYLLSLCQMEEGSNVITYPLFFSMLNMFQPRYNLVFQENNSKEIPNLFCAFIVGNPNCETRNSFFQYVCNKYKKVFSYGKVFNNTGISLDYPYHDERQLTILGQHKFVICFENTKTDDYYITEKILLAKASGSIPIYWGTRKCLDLFNKNSFLYLDEESEEGFEKLLSKIKMLDNNNHLYLSIRNQPLLTNSVRNKFSTSVIQEKISNYIYPKKDILFVSAYRDISRYQWNYYNRTNDEYINSFIKLATNISYTLIVYLEKHIRDKLPMLPSNIIILDLNDVKNTFYDKYLDIEKKIIASNDYQSKIPMYRKTNPEHIYAEYNLVNHNKINYISHTQKLFPNYEFYCWIDFGCIRNTISDVPKNINLSKLKVKKITYLSFGLPSENKISPLEMLKSNQIFFAGSQFVIHSDIIEDYEKIYDNKLLEFHQMNISDDDQNVTLQIYLDHPNLFDFKFDNEWFSLFRKHLNQ